MPHAQQPDSEAIARRAIERRAAPAGKEANWAPTSANGQFEVMFRLYGPEKPLFDKTWKLPDVEQIAAQ